MKRTNNEGSNFQEAFAAWKNKRNASGDRAGVAGGSTLGVPDWYKEAMQE